MAERRPPIRYIRGGLGLPMFRVRRPPEWGVEPVPHGLRVLRTFDLFVLWSSLGIGLLVLAAGTLLIGVGGFGFGLTLGESAIRSEERRVGKEWGWRWG